ncbi:Murein DD-endopeptidase MepM and murein hydrolase activator NlpD, contain LysM domain [Curtobacterium sp. UNCCL20]|uniref:M23 family metallopeptidase n=1 Tax=Curtobacterium sp. UNCCL20 TaxID=1502773 RepID=UPI0008817D92|nr:M23 family metallopeptidase [Curtobacterium sp. UNCCL20]SDQ69400.1 Murein DD-endopeptidase MepM and murein hydrolase activator NlpD, contain LysM domain [Curtobacterium sp. UNCCL20]
MPHSSLSPVQTNGPVDDAAPVVHMTRRARIEAERAAAAVAGTGDRAFDDLVSPTTPPAPASPIDLAPASPVMPASSASPVTPPAPASPVVAEASVRAAVPASTTSPASTTAPGTRRVLGQVPASRRAGRPVTATPATATLHVDRATRHLGAARPATTTTTTGHGASFRRAASRVTAVGALLFAAGLVVSTSLPAQALYTPETNSTSERQAAGASQSLSVGTGAVEAETNRDQYSVSDATQYKNVDASSFSNDPTGTIQWPFLTGVPITSGFGGRQVAGCSFCSTNHMGIDFAPGAGTPIRVIAAGTVIKVQPNDGGFGNDVWVQHDVDGKQFVSVYGHMQDNSFKVVNGQHVEVGDELGLVGSTGNSTGPHLHLEVHVDGVPVDPLAWLRANAN